MSKKLINKVKARFITEFNAQPLLVFSPGRINLIGEHTDYNEGFVFPAAINKGIALAIQQSDAEICQVIAIDMDESYEFKLADVKPLTDGGWKNYVLGVIGELQQRKIILPNFNIAFAGNIPGGAGLSSSAALENSVVFGFNELFNLNLSKSEMILISQAAEHNFVGVKCGIMDQYASMFGIKNNALLLDCRTVESTPYPIDFKRYTLMLINTNVKHSLSDSAYNDRRSVCENVAKRLNKKALRDVSLVDLSSITQDFSAEELQKATYVIKENLRVLQFSKAIEEGDLAQLGQLLFQSHEGLSTQYMVSCEELDFLVRFAKQKSTILGARMMGGGFGGCTLNLVVKKEFKAIKKEIMQKFTDEFGWDCSVYRVKLSKGTRLITVKNHG